MLKELMQSVRLKKVEHIDSVDTLLVQLYEAWQKAEEQGLGRDVKKVEERNKNGQSGFVRKTVAPTEKMNTSLNEGLNLTF